MAHASNVLSEALSLMQHAASGDTSSNKDHGFLDFQITNIVICEMGIAPMLWSLRQRCGKRLQAELGEELVRQPIRTSRPIDALMTPFPNVDFHFCDVDQFRDVKIWLDSHTAARPASEC